MIACVSRMTNRIALVSFFPVVFLVAIRHNSFFPACPERFIPSFVEGSRENLNPYSMRIFRNCLLHMLGPFNNDQIQWIDDDVVPAQMREFFSALEAIRIDMYES